MENVFRVEFIQTGYLAVDKKSLLKEMADFLQQKQIVESADDFFEVVWQREKVMSTGVGRSVALPHGNHPTVKELAVAAWQLAEPLNYDSIDQRPVQIVFMLAVPPSRQSSYMKVLAAISNYIRVPGNVDQLVQAQTDRQFYELVKNINI